MARRWWIGLGTSCGPRLLPAALPSSRGRGPGEAARGTGPKGDLSQNGYGPVVVAADVVVIVVVLAITVAIAVLVLVVVVLVAAPCLLPLLWPLPSSPCPMWRVHNVGRCLWHGCGYRLVSLSWSLRRVSLVEVDVVDRVCVCAA